MGGRCRGQGWQDNGFPKDVGKKNVQECSTSCQKTKGCSAFDLSNEENKKFDCLLFGHKHVIPASSQSMSGACYTMGTSASAIEEMLRIMKKLKKRKRMMMTLLLT